MATYFNQTGMVWGQAEKIRSLIQELAADFVNVITRRSNSDKNAKTGNINYFRTSLLSRLPYIGPHIIGHKVKASQYHSMISHLSSFFLILSNTVDNFINALTAFVLLLGYIIAGGLALVGTALVGLVEGAIMLASVLGSKISDMGSSFTCKFTGETPQERDNSSELTEKKEKKNSLDAPRTDAFSEIKLEYGETNAESLLNAIDKFGALAPVYLALQRSNGPYVVRENPKNSPDCKFYMHLLDKQLFKTFAYTLAQHRFLESQKISPSILGRLLTQKIPSLETVLNMDIQKSIETDDTSMITYDSIRGVSPITIAIDQLLNMRNEPEKNADLEEIIVLCLGNGCLLTTNDKERLNDSGLSTELKSLAKVVYLTQLESAARNISRNSPKV